MLPEQCISQFLFSMKSLPSERFTPCAIPEQHNKGSFIPKRSGSPKQFCLMKPGELPQIENWPLLVPLM